MRAGMPPNGSFLTLYKVVLPTTCRSRSCDTPLPTPSPAWQSVTRTAYDGRSERFLSVEKYYQAALWPSFGRERFGG